MIYASRAGRRPTSPWSRQLEFPKPGGGGLERLSALCGRSRTIEIVCAADDFDADRGELYGFVNRALPDGELEEYVDPLARRMSGFDKKALTLCKENINAWAGVPAQADLFDSNHVLHTMDDWPAAQTAGRKKGSQGMSSPGGTERNLPKALPAIM